MAKGLLLAAFDFSPAHEDEFHDWYDLEHVPERERIPGFLLCERWIDAKNPKQAVATYDLETVGVMQSAPYKAIAYGNLSVWSKRVTTMCKRLIRFEGEQIAGPEGPIRNAGGLLVNAMNVAREHEHEFNEWYNSEHIPALAKVPGCIAARRFHSTEKEGASQRYIALYHLSEPGVQETAAWKRGASSPWTDKLRPHFRDHLRIVSKRYVRAR
jgi:heme-degrading monooxygenase HmoA